MSGTDEQRPVSHELPAKPAIGQPGHSKATTTRGQRTYWSHHPQEQQQRQQPQPQRQQQQQQRQQQQDLQQQTSHGYHRQRQALLQTSHQQAQSSPPHHPPPQQQQQQQHQHQHQQHSQHLPLQDHHHPHPHARYQLLHHNHDFNLHGPSSQQQQQQGQPRVGSHKRHLSHEDPDAAALQSYEALKRHASRAPSTTRLQPRQWDKKIQEPSSDLRFSIMTYNLLSRKLAQHHMDLYRNSAPEAMQWENRSSVLLRELAVHDLDFFCLQELDEHDFVHLFLPAFKSRGYTGFYKRRNGDKPDGCAMFYRDSRVKAIVIEAVDYLTNEFITQDNVGIVGIFEITEGTQSKQVCVATTHILYNPRRGMIKIAQLRMLLEKAEDLIKRSDGGIPLVLCGDLNALPHSLVYRYLAEENVDVTSIPENYMSGQERGVPERGKYLNHLNEFLAGFRHTAQAVDIVDLTTSETEITLVTATSGVDAQSQVSAFSIAASLKSKMHISSPHNNHSESTSESSCSTSSNISPDEHLNIMTQPFKLSSSYHNSGTHGKRGNNRAFHGQSWTTFHGRAKLVCDYIFYGSLKNESVISSAQTPSRLEVVACLELPCRQLERCNGLPTTEIGSDHLSLVTMFKFV